MTSIATTATQAPAAMTTKPFDLVADWLRFAAVADKSAATYEVALKQLAKYLAVRGISTPTRADIEDWRESLIAAGKSPSTILLYLSSAKLFFRWLAQAGIYTNVADNLKARVKLSNAHKKDALTIKQVQALIKASEGKSLKALRDSAIIALLATTGVRTVEITRADICDIRQRGDKTYLYVQGKGRSEKAECVEIPPSVMSRIRAYLKARGKAPLGAPLFVSTSQRNKGERLETQTISRLVKSKLREIGLDLPTLTAHSLRHTAATIMLQAGQKLRDVQLVLRHKSMNTTLIYDNTIARWNIRAENVVAKILRI